MPQVKRREPEEVNLNLIPIMNLFTALIPFLLLSAAFFHLSVIKISVPVASTETGETDIAKEEDKITLQLHITDTAFDLAAASDTLLPEQLNKLRDKVIRIKGADKEAEKEIFKKLTDSAYRIRGKYAASDTVIVTCEPEIAYEVVVTALDAVREKTLERGGQKYTAELFPKAVLSSRTK